MPNWICCASETSRSTRASIDERVERRFPHAVGPPQPGIGHDQLRETVGFEADGALLARPKRDGLRELGRADRSADRDDDLAVGRVASLDEHGEPCAIQRRKIEPGNHIRMPQRDRAGVCDRRVAPQPEVLVGWSRIPVHPHDRKIVRLRTEDLDGNGIATPNGERRDVERVPSVRARRIIGRGDARTVHPDVRPIVDAVEVEPVRAPDMLLRHVELGAVPPGRLERAVCRRGLQHEARADRVGRPGNVPQVHAEVRIAVFACFHQGADHGVRHRSGMPAAGGKARGGNRRAAGGHPGRRLNHPAAFERQSSVLRGRRRTPVAANRQQRDDHQPQPPLAHVYVAGRLAAGPLFSNT